MVTGGFSSSKSRSSSQSSSTPTAVVTPDLMGSRQEMSNLFRGILRSQGYGFGTSPMGPLGSAYTALLSGDPTQDYLGAKSAIEGAISGDGFQRDIGAAYDAMLPSARRSIEELRRGVVGKMAPQGMRLSSAVLDQTRRGGEDILNNLLAQSVGAGLQRGGQRLQAGLGAMNFAQAAGESQLARQLPLLIQYLTSFAPVGHVSEGSSYGRSNAASVSGGFSK